MSITRSIVQDIVQPIISTVDGAKIETLYQSNFPDDGITGWSVLNGTRTAPETVDGFTDCILYTANAGASLQRYLQYFGPILPTDGTKFRVTFYYRLPSTNSDIVHLLVRNGNGSWADPFTPSTDTWLFYDSGWVTGTNSALRIFLCSTYNSIVSTETGGDDTLAVREVLIQQQS
jgi:hypothetical protein